MRILCERANLRMMANSSGRCSNLTHTLSALKRAELSTGTTGFVREEMDRQEDGPRPRELGDASFARPLALRGRGAPPWPS